MKKTKASTFTLNDTTKFELNYLTDYMNQSRSSIVRMLVKVAYNNVIANKVKQ